MKKIIGKSKNPLTIESTGKFLFSHSNKKGTESAEKSKSDSKPQHPKFKSSTTVSSNDPMSESKPHLINRFYQDIEEKYSQIQKDFSFLKTKVGIIENQNNHIIEYVYSLYNIMQKSSSKSVRILPPLHLISL